MWKEELKKIASWISEACELLKTDKSAGISKLEELAKTVDESEPTEDVNKEELEKIAWSVEEIKKWAYMSIDAETIKDLISQFTDLKENITKTVSKDLVEKVEKIEERLAKVEDEPVSKQEDLTKTDKTVSPFSGMFSGWK